MSETTQWMTFILIGLGTFAIRLSFIELHTALCIPPLFRRALLQTVLGAALIVAASFASGGLAAGLMGAGIANVAGGVLQMLSPQASGLSHSGSPENLASYAFGSAKNTTASGLPVPICIGERRWGGAIISASIEAQDKA